MPAPAAPAVSWRSEWRWLAALLGGFALLFWIPVESARLQGALVESLALTRDYAREHVLLCLVPALFIAGAISTFVSQAGVMRYLGPSAPRWKAYGVASVSGTVLAVCSCTVLPLFAGIHRMGAGLGPASTFLYAGPAINALAIILTARVLGLELGLARATGAVVFSVVLGLAMQALFRREERERAAAMAALPEAPSERPLAQNAGLLATMVAILVFANWGAPEGAGGVFAAIHAARWKLTAAAGLLLGWMLVRWVGASLRALGLAALPAALLALLSPEQPVVAFTAAVVGLSVVAARDPGPLGEWFASTWGYAKLILPLLVAGVLLAGLLLGRPGHEGLIPSAWIAELVGGNSLGATLFASFAGALMYFATLTEIPILQGLTGNGMGAGPALALLLAGPALSLPSMLVIHGVLGTRKTLAFVLLVVAMATLSGVLYGNLLA
jgi:uncharacterized membrane protein YraQ (UPF0718 family)